SGKTSTMDDNPSTRPTSLLSSLYQRHSAVFLNSAAKPQKPLNEDKLTNRSA
ncbi:hypothetical protein CEXT_509951, partial [Caerostris extrusa]